MEKFIDFHTKKSVNFVEKISSRSYNFVSVFKHLSTNQRLPAFF